MTPGSYGRSPLKASAPRVERLAVRIVSCPYDGLEIESETTDAGSRLWCPSCGAAWEWHGGWITRVRDPQRRPADAHHRPALTAGPGERRAWSRLARRG